MKTKRKYSYKGATKSILSYMSRALEGRMTLQKISEGLREIVNSYTGLNRNERYALYNEAYNLARAAKTSPDWKKKLSLRRSFDSILTTARKVKASSELRNKRNDTYRAIREGTIFFICSKHNNPAADHADYQGKIYVDRFWRAKTPSTLTYAVQSYIKNHHTISLQDIMSGPIWLTTRKYCKHFFIPLDTKTVLGNSTKKIVEQIGVQREKVYTAKEYYDIRKKVYTAMNKYTPCQEFEKIINRS